MIMSNFSPQSLLFKVAGVLFCIVLLVVGWYFITKHFESVGYDRRVAEEQVQRNKDLQAAAIQTRNLQHKLDEARNELSNTKQKLVAINSANVVLTSKLRDSLRAYNGSLLDYSKQTLIERTIALSSVVDDCTERYSEVATKADSYAADLKMMQNAWPK